MAERIMDCGRHVVEVTQTAITETKRGGHQVVVGFENGEGQTIRAYLSLSEAAWPHTDKKLRAIGFDCADEDGNVWKLNSEPSPCLGNKCSILVEEEEWQGRTIRKVSWINPIGEVLRAGEAPDLQKAIRGWMARNGDAPKLKSKPKPKLKRVEVEGPDEPDDLMF